MLNQLKIPSKVSYLLLLIPILFAFKCKKSKDGFYETISIELYNADNSGLTPVSAGDSVSKKAYALEIRLTMKALVDSVDLESYNYHINEDVVTDLQITSSTNFNGIPAHQSLNHLFRYREADDRYSEINTTNYTAIFSGGYSAHDLEWNANKYLLLMYPPDNAGNYTFYVTATFSDGRILSDSIPVNLHE